MPLTGWPSYSNDTGDGQSGTVITAELFDAIRASIEATVFGVTNPTIGAAAIIDEVVAARGSAVSLSARLATALAANGVLNPFSPQPTFKPGSAAVADGTVGGGVNSQSGAVANSGASETNLHSYSIQGSHMDVNNKIVRVTAFGTLAANANAKVIRAYVGATQVLSFSMSENDRNWLLSLIIIRTSSTQGKVLARVESGPKTDGAVTDNRLQLDVALAHTWTNSALVRTTGQGAASSDVVEDVFFAEAVN